MNMKELAAYRLKLIREATEMKRPERVPHISFFVTWKILDSGYKLTEAMTDYDIMERAVLDHQEKYNFDQLMETGTRNPYLVSKALGSSRYTINDEKGSINFTDFIYCEHEELSEMAADYNKFIWEKAMPRKYPFWNQDFDIDIIQNAINEFNKFSAFGGKVRKTLEEECGLPGLYAPNMAPGVPLETIFSYSRGIKGLSLDMRKEPAKLESLIATMADMSYYPVLENLKATDTKPSETCCFDLGTAFLCPNILNMKQWDKYYWPYVKPILDYAAEKKLNYMLFAEGSMMRFADYFKDYPKGVVTILPENDDVFEIRKNLPNFTIMGGMENNLLYNGTKEECLARAEKLIEELGGEGGFIMTQNKMGSFWNDANPENLKAVSDFVLSYKPSWN